MPDEFQLVLPGQWRERVEKWLESQGFYLAGPIPLMGDDLPTFIIGVPAPSLREHPQSVMHKTAPH